MDSEDLRAFLAVSNGLKCDWAVDVKTRGPADVGALRLHKLDDIVPVTLDDDEVDDAGARARTFRRDEDEGLGRVERAFELDRSARIGRVARQRLHSSDTSRPMTSLLWIPLLEVPLLFKERAR